MRKPSSGISDDGLRISRNVE